MGINIVEVKALDNVNIRVNITSQPKMLND